MSANIFYNNILTSGFANSGIVNSYCLDIEDSFEKSWPDIVKTCDFLLHSVNVMEGIIALGALRIVQERYTNALSQDKTNPRALQEAANRYFNICTQIFPLETAMLVQAAFELGQAMERTGADVFETITVYEKVVQLSQGRSVSIDPSIVTTVANAKDRLAALYHTVALNPSKMPLPMLDTVTAMYFDGYSGAKSHYGPSSPTTLTALAELVQLYSRAATESNQLSALQALRETVVDIISDEKSPLRLRESAMTLATIYTANGLTEQGLHIVEALRRQVIFKYAIKEDDFDLSSTPGLDRRSYVFIATLEEGLRASDSVSFSSVMSNLLTETHLFESFTSAAPFDLKLRYGARLRHFLIDGERYDQAILVENQLIAPFAANLDTSATPSEQNMREFLIRTIEEFEIDSQAGLGKPTSIAGEALTNGHIQQQDFQGSYDVALCAYKLTKSLGSYSDAESICYGFRLSLYMAGRGIDVSSASENVQSQMRDLAKTILLDMLDTCRQLNIDVAQMPLADLKDLASFLSELQSYAELEVRVQSMCVWICFVNSYRSGCLAYSGLLMQRRSRGHQRTLYGAASALSRFASFTANHISPFNYARTSSTISQYFGGRLTLSPWRCLSYSQIFTLLRNATRKPLLSTRTSFASYCPLTLVLVMQRQV